MLSGAVLWASFCPAQQGQEPMRPRILGERAAVPISRPIGADSSTKDRPQLPPDGLKVIDRLCRIGQTDRDGWGTLELLADDSQPAMQRRALPCEALEQMQKITADQPGAIFLISGETTVYGGKAYLLVTKVLIPSAPSAVAENTSPAAQPAAQEKTPDQSQPQATPPQPEPAGRTPSAQDIAEALLATQGPAKPVVVPHRTRPLDEQRPAPSVAPSSHKPLIDTGHSKMLIDRLVIFAPEPNRHWTQIHFQGDNTLREPPVRVLPSALLSKASSSPDGRMQYRISGELKEYRGQRYLLLRKVIYERKMGQF